MLCRVALGHADGRVLLKRQAKIEDHMWIVFQAASVSSSKAEELFEFCAEELPMQQESSIKCARHLEIGMPSHYLLSKRKW